MWFNLFVILVTILLGLHYIQAERVLSVKNRFGETKQIIRTDRKKYIIIICVLLIFQSGLRNVAVGADTYAYYQYFESVKLMSWKQVFDTFKQYYQVGIGKDPGYLVFQKIIQIVVSDYQIYLILIAVLFFSALGYFLYQNTRNVSDALFGFVLYSILFYSMFSITGTRQTIATALALWSYELIKKRKLILFLLLILLSSTIHKSILIFIPLYFSNNKTTIKYMIALFVVLWPLMFVFSNEISSFFQSLDNSYSQYEKVDTLKPYNFVVMQFILFFMGVFTFKTSFIQASYRNTVFWYSALLLSIFFTTQVLQIHVFMRIIYYFSIFNLLLIPHMFKIIALKLKTKYKYIFTAGIFILILMYIGAAGGSEYKFFWQSMELGENYR